MFGDQSEKWWHQGSAKIGKCHLNADHCLRVFFAEIVRGGMDDRRIDRSAAQSDDDKPNQAGAL